MQGRPGGCPGELVPEAEALDRLQSDVARRDRTAWDAWDAVRPDVMGDAVRQLLALPADADAGKSVDPVQDDPVQGDLR